MVYIASTFAAAVGQGIYREDNSKIKDRNDLVQCFLKSSVRPDNCSRSSLSEKTGNNRQVDAAVSVAVIRENGGFAR